MQFCLEYSVSGSTNPPPAASAIYSQAVEPLINPTAALLKSNGNRSLPWLCSRCESSLKTQDSGCRWKAKEQDGIETSMLIQRFVVVTSSVIKSWSRSRYWYIGLDWSESEVSRHLLPKVSITC